MRKMALAEDGTDLGFEEVYRRLEEAVERLEGGGLSLEESIDLYEAGMRLAHRCKQLLDAAELRVTELQQEFGSDAHERSQEDANEESE